MYAWDLPKSLEICGRDIEINTDFRQILNILVAFTDPELTPEERWIVTLNLFYKEPLAEDELQEGAEKMTAFIDAGVQGSKDAPTLMDWEQDAPIIIPAVNRSLGYECRTLPYLHWWTFLGGYMEIGECLFSNVVSIRSKKAKGEKLEKYEKEFERHNKKLIEIKRKLTDDEKEQDDENKAELKALLGL